MISPMCQGSARLYSPYAPSASAFIEVAPLVSQGRFDFVSNESGTYSLPLNPQRNLYQRVAYPPRLLATL